MNTMPFGLVALTRKPRSHELPRRSRHVGAGVRDRRGGRAPLLDAEIDEVRRAQPLDGGEQRGRCRDDRAEARRDDREHEQDAELKPEDVPHRAHVAVAHAGGHARDRARPRRQADQPGSDEEREPGLERHARILPGTTAKAGTPLCRTLGGS
jgi:hypothetical protein